MNERSVGGFCGTGGSTKRRRRSGGRIPQKMKAQKTVAEQLRRQLLCSYLCGAL